MSKGVQHNKARLVLGALGLVALLVIVFFAGRGSTSREGEKANGENGESSSPAETQVEYAPPPEVEVASQLPDSPLNALLQEGLSPEKQTEIVGRFLLDYWVTHRSLPTGTFEEMKILLSGGNRKKIEYLPLQHPALAEKGFQAKGDPAEVVVHVRSSREGVFELIYTGPDGVPYTDDDLIRRFPE